MDVDHLQHCLVLSAVLRLTIIDLAPDGSATFPDISTLSRCQFHPHFYLQIFCTNVVLADFSSYILALAKNFYKKCAHLTLIKLTVGGNFINILHALFSPIFWCQKVTKLNVM